MYERFTRVFSVDIATELYRIAKNYAEFDEEARDRHNSNLPVRDREYESSHQHQYVCSFDEIEPYYIEGQIDFHQDKIEEVRIKVEGNFKYIESAFEGYKKLYNTRDWEENAEQSFMTEINKAANYASETFAEICSQISTCMQKTIEDMQNTENANMINRPIPPGQFPKIKLDLDN